jgi:hypothetical protein
MCSSCNFFVIKLAPDPNMDPDPQLEKMLDPDLHQTMRIHNPARRETKYFFEEKRHLDLLLEVVPDAHAQLIELIPLLGQSHCAVLRIPTIACNKIGSFVIAFAYVNYDTGYWPEFRT